MKKERQENKNKCKRCGAALIGIYEREKEYCFKECIGMPLASFKPINQIKIK